MSELEKNWKTNRSARKDSIDASNKIQSSTMRFGISYLDDALYGIFNHDVILIGAPSGGGKTTLATIICKSLAEQKLRVAMFALEAMEYEITYRIAHLMNSQKDLSFGEFLFQTTPQEREEMILSAIPDSEDSDLIRVFYKKDTFTPSDLTREMYALEENCDAIILDYFGFIDLHGERNEFTEQKELVNEINRLQKVVGKPIIILAQFSKSFAKSAELFPSLSDFYGTSALVNMCTKVITISNRTPDGYTATLGKRPTIFHIPKFRFDGDRSSYFAICPFVSERANYENYYYLFDAYKKEIIGEYKKPRWAKNAKESRPYES